MQEALIVMEPLNNPLLQAMYMGKMAAFTAMYTARSDQAEVLFCQAITAWRVLDDDEQRAIVQFNYAVMLHEIGRGSEALPLAHESMELLQAQGHYHAQHMRAAIEAWQRGEDAPSSVAKSGGTRRWVHRKSSEKLPS